MGRIVKQVMNKIIVLLVITSMMMLSVKDREANAATEATKETNSRPTVIKWDRATDFRKCASDGQKYHRVLFMYEVYNARAADKNAKFYYVLAGTEGTGDGGFRLNSGKGSIVCNYYAVGYRSDLESDHLPLNIEYEGKPAVLLDEIDPSMKTFTTTQLTDTWCLMGPYADVLSKDKTDYSRCYGEDYKYCQLYTSMNAVKAGKAEQVRLNVDTTGGKHQLCFEPGYPGIWRAYEYDNDEVIIRDSYIDYKYGAYTAGVLYHSRMEISCAGMPLSSAGGSSAMLMYIGTDYACTVLDERNTVTSGQVLNINDKDSEEWDVVTYLPAGQTLIIEPGGVVIVKGLFICQGSVENFGTLLLCGKGRMCSASPYNDGACMINNYGSNLTREEITDYLRASWQTVHGEIDNYAISRMIGFIESGKATGNLIIRSSACLAQNRGSHRLMLLGGAHMYNDGWVATFNDIVSQESTITVGGGSATILGIEYPMIRKISYTQFGVATAFYPIEGENYPVCTEGYANEKILWDLSYTYMAKKNSEYVFHYIGAPELNKIMFPNIHKQKESYPLSHHTRLDSDKITFE